MHESVLFLVATLSAGTPLALAALGLLVNERAGVVNLGSEGMMLLGALAGFAMARAMHGAWAGFAAGALAGAVFATVLGLLIVWLDANQYAAGLGLTLFGAGLSTLLGTGEVGHALIDGGGPGIAVLGPVLGRLHPVALFVPVLAVAMHLALQRTRVGLVLRAVGDSPHAAHALGYPVRWIRLAALVAGGALCGLAGAYLSEVAAPMWSQGMSAGRGWIALALTTFATWRPLRVLLGAYLFGAITALQFRLQGLGVEVPAQVLGMTPYLATIAVLCAMSVRPAWVRANMPASLGRAFRA